MKIGILTSKSISEFREKSLAPILNDPLYTIKIAIIDNRPKKTLKQKIIKNLKKGRGGYIFIMALQSFFKKGNSSKTIKQFCEQNKIEEFYCDKLYSEETINKIKALDLDVLLLVGGYGIIKEPLLRLTRFGILSYHHGNIRKYRGMPPALWELYNGEKEMGVTVQLLSKGLDAGYPVVEKTISIFENDNLESLYKRAVNESVDMMYLALKKIQNITNSPIDANELGPVYTLPNFSQWFTLQCKVLYRKVTFKPKRSNKS